MTLRKFKFATFWMIQRMKVLVARNSRLPPPSRSRGRGQKRRKNRKDFSSSVLVTSPVDVLQGVRGRASDRCELCRGGLCKRGGGSENGKGRKQRSEKRRRWCGGGWIEAGFLACHYHVRGFHLPLLSYLSRPLADKLKFENVARDRCLKLIPPLQEKLSEREMRVLITK